MRSRVFTNEAFLAELGPTAQLAYIDCSVTPPAGDTQIDRAIRRMLASSPMTSFAFGSWWLTNSRGDAVYRTMPCLCVHSGLNTVADLLRQAELPKPPSFEDTNAQLITVREGMELYREHRRLRREAAGDPGAAARLAAFESEIADPTPIMSPCRLAGDSRIPNLGLADIYIGGRAEGFDGLRERLVASAWSRR